MKNGTALGGFLVAAIWAGGTVLLAAGGEKASPPAQQAGDQHPSALFVEYCAKCHGQDGTGNTPRGKQLMARDFTDAEWQSSKKDEQLIKQVHDGSEDMPAFGKKLTKEQIEGLIKNDVRGFAKKK
ncbi:MAG TPA: cytochrome c [Thermoanaerobaculia bacterium]|nr:cytochrome c [Thermoanaerobaculia bacterium]